MALTKISGSILKDPLNLGEVSIGGTLTYEDVTNVDSLGIGTFRTGINVSGGQIDVGSNIKLGNAGVVTATSFTGSGANLTNLPAANLTGTLPAISGANLTNLPVPTTITVADESSDTTCNPLFVTTTSGNLAPKTGTNLTFNSSSGNLRTSSLFLGTGSNESKTQDGLILERNSGDGEVHITAGRSGGNYSGLQFYVAGGSGVTKRHQMIYDGSFRWYGADGTTERLRIDSSGHLLPGATDNSLNLGSSSARWANIYTGDLQLSNEGKTNDVDGTWGNYTIQEGESDLFLINNRSGKKYKFNLTEVL
mgnify:CR=1 FL=1